MTGTIDRVRLDKNFGFIRPDDGSPEVFFHKNTLSGLVFDATLFERRVEFETIHTGRELLSATIVRPECDL